MFLRLFSTRKKINLIHHKSDFNIEASWPSSASGHGKGPSLGIGATAKSSASRSTLSSGTILSSTEDFFNFTKRINEEAAALRISNEPSRMYIKRYFLLKTFLLGRIKDIRQVYQFDPKDEFNIFCRKTSSSFADDEFTLRTNTTDEQIKRIEDISIDHIVIVNEDDKHFLAKVIDVREPMEEVILERYEHCLSLSSYIRCSSKAKTKATIPYKNIIAHFICSSVFGRRNQLSLSKEQFQDIQKPYA
ncbi:unnamed protein product [Adineta ricciae]|uniref:Uncharacterized protein n=1 Tax=Adineta ricciae TaxID=249248 RepID=A0A815NM56_ADIRI|nr:unnamed protein product [Adineta ricciae]CAF1571189.1 unnamed protein product [Adineta ricciae]